jgi:flagellar basal-body rod modification protein FlgD
MALGSVSAVSQAASLTGSNLQDFLRIVATQLQYQDPLAPSSNEQFVAQLAQFASLEQARAMSSNMESLLGVQTAAQAMDLLGRAVDVQTAAGAASGKVIELDFSSSEPLLTVSFVAKNGTATGATSSNVRLSQVIRAR